MKKISLVALLSLSVLLVGCADDPLKAAKKTVFSTYDSSVTIGQVLDRYQTCKPNTQQWTLVDGTKKAQYVQFSCVDEEFPQFMQKQVKTLLGVFAKHPIIPESATKDLPSFVNWATWMLEFGRVLLGSPSLESTIEEVDKLKSIDIASSTFKVRFEKNAVSEKYDLSFVGYDVTYGNKARSTVELPGFVLEACYKNQPVMLTVEGKKADISDALVQAYKLAQGAEKAP